MAKINGIAPLFRISQVVKVFNDLTEKVEKTSLETLQFMGEQFVNLARVKGNYNDRTGNLRSSIGYIISENGKILDANFETSEKGSDRNAGKRRAEDFAHDLAIQFPKQLMLIGVAGMEYAFWVENRHHLDVISGSVPEDGSLKSILDEIEF